MIMMWIAAGSAGLAVVALLAAALLARRAEAAAQVAKAASVRAQNSADSARKAEQQARGLVTAYADGPAPILPEPPKCPLDGAPLVDYHHEAGRPAHFVHADGSEHDDYSAAIRTAPPVPNPYAELAPSERVEVTMPSGANPLFEPATPEQRPSTVDTYFQRVSDGVDAGLIEPDKLIGGVGHITRNDWNPLADVPEQVPERPPNPSTKRRMPSPTRAARVAGSRRRPVQHPNTPNGDGS